MLFLLLVFKFFPLLCGKSKICHLLNSDQIIDLSGYLPLPPSPLDVTSASASISLPLNRCLTDPVRATPLATASLTAQRLRVLSLRAAHTKIEELFCI